MKNIGYILFGLIMSTNILMAQEDAITKLFNNFSEDEAFSTIYISPKMFQMIAKLDGEGDDKNEIADISKDIKTLRILSTSNTPRKFYKQANKKLNLNSYEELMTIKEEGKDIRFVTKMNGDKIEELLLLIGSDENFVLLSFTGDIDLEKLSRLSGKLNIQGSDQFSKLNKK